MKKVLFNNGKEIVISQDQANEILKSVKNEGIGLTTLHPNRDVLDLCINMAEVVAIY